MLNKLKEIEDSGINEINGSSSTAALEELRIKYLGKKGALTSILRQLGTLSSEERPKVGAAANVVRQKIEARIEQKLAELESLQLDLKLKAEKVDVTLPGRKKEIGHLHPLRSTENRMIEIFVSMGFDLVEGPEVESVYNNFDALNAPADHPSRDETDTFRARSTAAIRPTPPIRPCSTSSKVL